MRHARMHLASPRPFGTTDANPWEAQLQWTPSAERAEQSEVERFRQWINQRHGLALADYPALWAWSVTELDAFWAAIWDYFQVQSDTPYQQVRIGSEMPDVRWFAGSRVNYTEHLLRAESRQPDAVALRAYSELRDPCTLSWAQLGQQVRCLATRLRAMGVGPGDCVAAYLPNGPETVIAMMAATAIGAVWALAPTAFRADAVLDRFRNLRPRVLILADGYRQGGQDIGRADELSQVLNALPELQHVIHVPQLAPALSLAFPQVHRWQDLVTGATIPAPAFRYERVAHDHPLWVLFSSGTTGTPKAVVHSHVGVLLEHLKFTAFHLDVNANAKVLFHFHCGWMMWNLQVATLLQGATIVLVDGSALTPGPERLWTIADEAQVSHLGVTPGLVQRLQKNRYLPKNHHELKALQSVLLAGAPALPQTFTWFDEAVKRDLWVSSQSGGAEIASAFVGGSPSLPVYAGQIQARLLGMDVQVWDEQGRAVVDQTGELVVAQPAPSMPLRMWQDDEQKTLYRQTYFSRFSGVWCHGDPMRLDRRGGCYLYGGTDSMLTRYGISIGSAEIYRSVEQLEEVQDSLIVCCELAGGRFFMPMFIKLKAELLLDEALRARILRQIRSDCSPRHVPDQLYQVTDIPYTLTGKKMEVPVRKILTGWPLEKAASRHAMANPESLDWFLRFRRDNEPMLTG